MFIFLPTSYTFNFDNRMMLGKPSLSTVNYQNHLWCGFTLLVFLGDGFLYFSEYGRNPYEVVN